LQLTLGGQFATSVIDSVVHLELQISSRILEKVADGAAAFIRGPTGGKMICEKYVK
jgi:hypothetical protein